jgi:hypothetical protein
MESSDDTKPGRAAGGRARAEVLPAEKRAEIARRAAAARWTTPILQATHGSQDHPLRIGDVEIPCYVLEDGTRMLSQRGLIGGLGMKPGGSSHGADRLALFFAGKGISPFVSNDLMTTIQNPIRFRSPSKGPITYGYPATILADICDAVLAARKAGALQSQQLHIAERCEILVRGFARVGIIALVDEATGYQNDRAADSLARILEAFIAKELQPWVRTFPPDFYQEMFRLRGLEYPTTTVQRPQYFGVLTNNIVYKRLAPGVLDELKKVTERNEEGRPKHKYFQKLTSNVGYPKLREHLGSVVTIMKLSENYADFTEKLDRIHPVYGKTMPLALEYRAEDDDGKGI